MPYAYLTLGQLKALLAARLDDSASVFWTNTAQYSELRAYIVEALRTWSAISRYWRDRGVFDTVANQAFYDLPALLLNGANESIRAYTVTDQELVATLQYQLLENAGGQANPAAWIGTEQYVLDDFTKALERRRNQFLAETGMIVTRSVLNSGRNPAAGRIALDDSVIDVRRIAWITPEGVYTQLWVSDEFIAGAFNPAWPQSPATPSQYATFADPVLTLQLIPPPNDVGSIEMLAVQAPAALDPTVGVLMNIPDDFTWVVKWGALADLLNKDGRALDPARAKFCEQMYQQGIEAARSHVSLLHARINDVPVQTQSVMDLDTFSAGWQNSTGAPAVLGMAADNLLALSKVPDGIYGVTVDVVRNAPVPTVDADNIQLGREELDAVLNYAVFLAMFKQGGAEFQVGIESVTAMLRMAGIKTERFVASSTLPDEMADRATREDVLRPRRTLMTEDKSNG